MSLSDDHDSGSSFPEMAVDLDDPMEIDPEHDAAWRRKIWAEIVARKAKLAQQE